jgi:hypothetical protein
MSTRDTTCHDSARREEVRRHSGLNGLDYLEVDAAQRTIEVYFLGKAPTDLRRENVRVEGGRRIRDIRVEEVRLIRVPDPGRDDRMVVKVDRWGDSSIYSLRLAALDHEGRPTDAPMPGVDQRFDRLDLDFMADCPSDIDCKQPERRAPAGTAPPIDYLAKDYASFRRIILDRLATVMPDWQDRQVPDLGITLVELLAYAADHLSYYQDAVATEAYLETARRRISVRRHARLVDYAMHEGASARTWVTLEVDDDLTLPPEGAAPDDLFFVTGWQGMPPAGTVLAPEDLPPSGHEMFEPVRGQPLPLRLRAAHNQIRFYTWGERQCHLPRGATAATLRDPGQPADREYEAPGHGLALAPGDVLLFEEVKGPRTGEPADADPRHRHAVRLTRVEPGFDPLYQQAIVEIAWEAQDALPYSLCITAVGRAPECELIEDVSLARGNVVLVDHGQRVEDEDLPPVPGTPRSWRCEDECRAVELTPRPPRYRPRLARGGLTFVHSYENRGAACAALAQDPRRAGPWLELRSGTSNADGTFVPATSWQPRSDLLRSTGDDHHVVVEVDDDGQSWLRFGDDVLGRRPAGGSAFRATYRVGHGPDGNVAAEAIARVGLRRSSLEGVQVRVRNPLPARGGAAPEPVLDVRRLAPDAWRNDPQRAITADDYARIAERHPRVDRAAARLRWSGFGWVVQVALDPRGRTEVEPALLAEVSDLLAPYRRVGHEVLVAPAQYVPLDVEIHVCVLPEYHHGHVRGALLDVLSNGRLPDGTLGFFHPDRLSFGDDVRLSALIAAARAVTGVESVHVRRFQRLGEEPRNELDEGLLRLGPFEIARLDNDPTIPENGRLRLDLRGGR